MHPASSKPLPPVTLQQLQLVTCHLAQVPAYHLAQVPAGSTLSTVLLLSLLLQRADPGVRAEFLGSPVGSLMLHVLGHLSTLESSDDPFTLLGGFYVMHATTALAARVNYEAVLGQQSLRFGSVPVVTASLQALTWAHLEVQQGDGTGACPVSMASPVGVARPWTLLATEHVPEWDVEGELPGGSEFPSTVMHGPASHCWTYQQCHPLGSRCIALCRTIVVCATLCGATLLLLLNNSEWPAGP